MDECKPLPPPPKLGPGPPVPARRCGPWRSFSARWRSARSAAALSAAPQRLELVHFSAQLEPCLTHKNTLHTLNNPKHPVNTSYTTPLRTPCPIKALELSSEVNECKPLPRRRPAPPRRRTRSPCCKAHVQLKTKAKLESSCSHMWRRGAGRAWGRGRASGRVPRTR